MLEKTKLYTLDSGKQVQLELRNYETHTQDGRECESGEYWISDDDPLKSEFLNRIHTLELSSEKKEAQYYIKSGYTRIGNTMTKRYVARPFIEYGGFK